MLKLQDLKDVDFKKRTIILGGTGSGKTHLLNKTAKSLQEQGCAVIFIDSNGLNANDFLKECKDGNNIILSKEESGKTTLQILETKVETGGLLKPGSATIFTLPRVQSNATAQIILQSLWDAARIKSSRGDDTPVVFLIDDFTSLYIQNKLELIEDIAKQGRPSNVGLILATQVLIMKNSEQDTITSIASCCDNQIVGRIEDENIDYISDLLKEKPQNNKEFEWSAKSINYEDGNQIVSKTNCTTKD